MSASETLLNSTYPDHNYLLILVKSLHGSGFMKARITGQQHGRSVQGWIQWKRDKDRQDGSQGGRDGSRERQSLYLTGSTWRLPNLGSGVAFEAIQLFEEGGVTVLQRQRLKRPLSHHTHPHLERLTAASRQPDF